eukprot:425680_1
MSSLVRIAVVGDANIGKTCLLMSYRPTTTDEIPSIFSPIHIKKKILIHGKRALRNITLCDTGPNAKQLQLRMKAYKNADIIMVCFDIMNPESLQSVDTHWMQELDEYAPNAVLVLIGLKCDLRSAEEHENEIPSQMIYKYTTKYSFIEYVETSALRKKNVDHAFEVGVQTFLEGGGKHRMTTVTVRSNEEDKPPSYDIVGTHQYQWAEHLKSMNADDDAFGSFAPNNDDYNQYNNDNYDIESSPELAEMFPPPNELQTHHESTTVSTLHTNLSPRANLSPRTNLSPRGHLAIPNQMDDVPQRPPASTVSTLHTIMSPITNVATAENPIHDMVLNSAHQEEEESAESNPLHDMILDSSAPSTLVVKSSEMDPIAQELGRASMSSSMSQSGSSYGGDTYTSYDESTLQLNASPQQKEAQHTMNANPHNGMMGAAHAQSFHPMNGVMVRSAAYNNGAPQVLSWAGPPGGAAAMMGSFHPNNDALSAAFPPPPRPTAQSESLPSLPHQPLRQGIVQPQIIPEEHSPAPRPKQLEHDDLVYHEVDMARHRFETTETIDYRLGRSSSATQPNRSCCVLL